MGGRASSSKRKLKRDKISSKKKSRRKESKKHRRHYDSARSSSDDDSPYSERSLSTSKSNHKRRTSRIKKLRHDSSSSSYSDYQSVSSDSDSSSTDGYDYKVRKARRLRAGLKDTKRKFRKKSTSSIIDEDASSGRKRKRVGRYHDIRPIKRSSKKKPKKDLGSSSDSVSESCSACQSGSSSSRENDKHKRKRVVSDKEKARQRGPEKGKQKHKDRSPSCTLISRDSNPGFTVPNSDEVFIPVDYSRRLRSVITFVDEPHNKEEIKWEKDHHKEEIVYDQNDYFSPKSLDSNEDGTKIDSDNQFNVAFSDKVLDTENIADNGECELEKSRIDEGDHINAGDCQSEGGLLNNSEEKEFNKSVPLAALGGDVLESILRQKALENLRKFQKLPQASPRSNMMKTNSKTTVVGLSDGTVDTIPNESTEQGSSAAQEMNQGSGILLERETAEVVKLPDGEQVEKKPESAKMNITHSEDEKSACSVVAKAVSGSNPSPRTIGSKVSNSSNVEPISAKLISGEHNSEQNNEAKEGSQFEQKTMSVMRGGELVQVSYKVYIPNKSHALARRQLRR